MRKTIPAVALMCAAMMITASCSKKAETETETSASAASTTVSETTSVPETSETSGTTQATETTETTAAPSEFKISLSGKAADKTIVDKNSYYEGEDYVIYFEKDSTVYGDTASRIDSVMHDMEELYGMSYGNKEYAVNAEWKQLYGFGNLGQVNSSGDKIDIVICKDMSDGSIECCDSNAIFLFDSDFEPERDNYSILYHEFAHLLRLRQSPNLGKVLEEGIGSYTEDRMARSRGESAWDTIQYVSDDIHKIPYDDSVIVKDPEQEFRDNNIGDRADGQKEYQYGIRFIAFLVSEYGDGIVKTLSENACKYDYDSKDNDAIIKIIKESTSDDIFERFAKWLPKGWKAYSRDYFKYMEKKGLM